MVRLKLEDNKQKKFKNSNKSLIGSTRPHLYQPPVHCKVCEWMGTLALEGASIFLSLVPIVPALSLSFAQVNPELMFFWDDHVFSILFQCPKKSSFRASFFIHSQKLIGPASPVSDSSERESDFFCSLVYLLTVLSLHVRMQEPYAFAKSTKFIYPWAFLY